MGVASTKKLLIQAYQQVRSKENLKLNTLRIYLKDHPAYIGHIKSRRFSYQYEKLEPDPVNSKFTRRMIQKAERNTSCIALDYEKLAELGIDLQRIKETRENITPGIAQNDQLVLEKTIEKSAIDII